MIKTYKFRLKDNKKNYLTKMAHDVNFVWNYCNETSIEHLDKKGKWLSGYDLGYLTAGCSEYFTVNAQTIEATAHEYALKRRQYKKRKLSWRSKKRSLGWIPLKGQSIRVDEDTLIYNKQRFKFWKSRDIGKIKAGSFNEDSKGNWYINLSCEVPNIEKVVDNRSVGIDLGLKTIATTSDGEIIDRENLTTKYAAKLAMAQCANKKKQVKAIHSKIKNCRKDFNHKQTTKLINSYGTIFVGDVSSSKLKKTRMAKSVSDASWADFKSMLAYKAMALGVEYKEVKESYSTVTCSACFERTGPIRLGGLGVRVWACNNCGTEHDRDVNAAKNILRFGYEALIKGVPKKKERYQTTTPERI